MSSVVLMELEVGAGTLAARRAVKRLGAAFERTGRLVPPSPSAWRRTASALRGLQARGRELRRASLVHDVLIALTARELGATVLTRDASDYAEIQRLVDVSVMTL